MKHLSFLYSDKTRFKEAVIESKNKRYNSQLIQVFTTPLLKKDLLKKLKKLKKKFPKAIIVGATTAGEISHAKIKENSTVISLSLFENTTLKTYYTKKITTKSAKQLYKNISSKNIKAAIVLSEGLYGEDYDGFTKGIKKANPNFIIAGGLAGDNFKLEQTSIFLNDKIYNKGAIAVSFSGKNLYADNRYNLNWIPIGKEFTITSADKNILYEIDNTNAIEIFKRYLGDEITNNNASALPNFQLLYKEGNTVVSRTPMAIDGNSIVLAAPIKNNQRFRFGFSNATSVISGSNKISDEISTKPAEAIYIYSCIARKTLLGKVLENEFRSFEDIAPTSGFFTYGEFYSADTNNTVLNCTTTILVLSESQKVKHTSCKHSKTGESTLDHSTFNALTHFIKQTSIELDSNIKLHNQYKDIVDQSFIVSKTDKNGIITYVNDNFCKVSGYTKEDLIGQNHNIIRDKSVPVSVFRKMWETISSGRIWSGILSNITKDAKKYYVDATIMPIFDQHGDISEYIAIRYEITKQIESNKRIKEKEKLIKAIFDNQENIVIYASKSRGMLNVNQALFKYLDYKDFNDFKDKNKCICDAFIKEQNYIDPQTYPNWFDDIANNRLQDAKVKIKTKDGLKRVFSLTIKKIGNDEYIINLSDITTLQNAILKANSSKRAKSIFLANMSHEIRTPLNGILGFTDILVKKDKLDNDAKRYIDIIHKSGQTLLNVVNDILDFSKIESGELSIFETESDLFKEVEAMVATFASVAKNKHIEYFTYIDSKIPKLLQCDIQRIKQVLSNLISNAIKFTPDSGKVGVNIVLTNKTNNKANISFSVRDSGIGISKDKIATIFQPFSQADDSISREYGGTGLGLSISSQYIKMMNSELKVKSVENEGSEFFFELSLKIIDEKESIESIHNDINIEILKSKTDIQCDINNIITNYLDIWGYHYKYVNNIDEVDNKTDIFIICSKLFDQEKCENILNKHTNLNLFYIEGGDDVFNCSHKQFHLIEQPVTGSALFNKIVTIFSSSKILNRYIKQTDNKYFNGNILVAEDNETNRMLISIMLEERGLNYTIVNNGQEAVDQAMKKDFDIIFMDINMPVLDGISATRQLRASNYNKPIVSLSANVIADDILSFKEAGMDQCLNKPIVAEELDKVLANYLNKDSFNNIEFDTIDAQDIAKKLSLPNTDIVFKLLKSFANSATDILKRLKDGEFNEEIIHNIKGVAGNLRFNNLYKFSIELEKNMQEYSQDEKDKNKKLLILHIEHIVNEILKDES